MSNITFMIGNGFDLACGLKSRFSDTYDGYTAMRSSSTIVEHFKQAIKIDITTWADFEMQLVQYAKVLKSEEELTKCIRDYDAYLNDYLEKEQQAFWDKYNELGADQSVILDEMERSLTNFYFGLTQNDIHIIKRIIDGNPRDEPINYDFISFNYTNIIDVFVNALFSSGLMSLKLSHPAQNQGILHIHGTLGGDVTLGVDNETQLVDIPYQISNRAKRVLIKPEFLRAYDVSRSRNAISIIQHSSIICVFGLSLGDSDLTWRSELAKWLKAEVGHHLVFYKHSYMIRKYHSTAKTERMDDEEDCKETIISLLFGETIAENERLELRKRIHVPVGEQIFNVDKAFIEATAKAQKRKALKENQKRLE